MTALSQPARRRYRVAIWNGFLIVVLLSGGLAVLPATASTDSHVGPEGVTIFDVPDLASSSTTRSGATVDGITCRPEAKEVVKYHVHVHVTIYFNGDMQRLPFADASFDLIVSRAAIHNVYDAAERDRVIGEIVRVLKPGGQALINDIRHGPHYRQTFERLGCRVVSFASPAETLTAVLLSFGSLRPAKLQAVKIS